MIALISPTHFIPLVSFYTPWKYQKTRKFWYFQGAQKERKISYKMNNTIHAFPIICLKFFNSSLMKENWWAKTRLCRYIIQDHIYGNVKLTIYQFLLFVIFWQFWWNLKFKIFNQKKNIWLIISSTSHKFIHQRVHTMRSSYGGVLWKKMFFKISKSCRKTPVSEFFQTLFWMGIFGFASGLLTSFMAAFLSSKTWHTYPTMMKLGTVTN